MTYQGQSKRSGVPNGLRPTARLAIGLSFVCVVGGALGQGAALEPLPDFEAWIVEAE